MAIGVQPPTLLDDDSQETPTPVPFSEIVGFVEPRFQDKPANVRKAILQKVEEQWNQKPLEYQLWFLDQARAHQEQPSEQDQSDEGSQVGAPPPKGEPSMLQKGVEWATTPFGFMEDLTQDVVEKTGMKTGIPGKADFTGVSASEKHPGGADDPGRHWSESEFAALTFALPTGAPSVGWLRAQGRPVRAVIRGLAEAVIADVLPDMTTPADIPGYLIAPLKGAAIFTKSGSAALRAFAKASPYVARALRAVEVGAGLAMASAGVENVIDGMSDGELAEVARGAFRIAGGALMVHAPKAEKEALAAAEETLSKKDADALKTTLKEQGKRRSRKFKVGDEGVDSAGNRFHVVDDLGGGELQVQNVESGSLHRMRSSALKKQKVGAPPPRRTVPEMMEEGNLLDEPLEVNLDDDMVVKPDVEAAAADVDLTGLDTAHVGEPPPKVEVPKEVETPKAETPVEKPVEKVAAKKKGKGGKAPNKEAKPAEPPPTIEDITPEQVQAELDKRAAASTEAPVEAEPSTKAEPTTKKNEVPSETLRDEWDDTPRGDAALDSILDEARKWPVPPGSYDEIDAVWKLINQNKIKLTDQQLAALHGYTGKLNKAARQSLRSRPLHKDDLIDYYEGNNLFSPEFGSYWTRIPQEASENLYKDLTLEDAPDVLKKLRAAAEAKGLDPDDPDILRQLALEDPELAPRVQAGQAAAEPKVGEPPPSPESAAPEATPEATTTAEPPPGYLSNLNEQLKAATTVEELEEIANTSEDLMQYRIDVAQEAKAGAKVDMEKTVMESEAAGYSADADGAKAYLRDKAFKAEIKRRNEMIAKVQSQRGVFRFGGRGHGRSVRSLTPTQRRDKAVLDSVENQLRAASKEISRHLIERKQLINAQSRRQRENLLRLRSRLMKQGRTFDQADRMAKSVMKTGGAQVPPISKPVLQLSPRQQKNLAKWIWRELGDQDAYLPMHVSEVTNKLLNGEDVTRGELELFTKTVLGRDLADLGMGRAGGLKGTAKKVAKGLGNASYFFTTWRAAADISAVLRQGLIGSWRSARYVATGGMSGGNEWLKAWKDMFKGATSERAFEAVQDDVFNRATRKWHDHYDLYRAKRGDRTALWKREEELRGEWAEKLPVVGPVIAASNRAYVAFLNKMRVDMFDNITNDLIKKGFHPDDPQAQKVYESLAEYINITTGRGDLRSFEKFDLVGGRPTQTNKVEEIANALSTVMYSPRFRISRMQYLGRAATGFKGTQWLGVPGVKGFEGPIAGEAAKDLATGVIGILSILSLAQMSGMAEITLDVQDPDFAKLRIGNTRVDLSAGLSKELHDWVVLGTGERVDKYGIIGPASRMDKAVTYGVGRLAPLPGFIAEQGLGRMSDEFEMSGSGLGGGKNPVTGEYQDLPHAAGELFTPFVVDAVRDAAKANPDNTTLENLLIGVFDGTGMATSSYDEFDPGTLPPVQVPSSQDHFFNFTPLIGEPPPKAQ